MSQQQLGDCTAVLWMRLGVLSAGVTIVMVKPMLLLIPPCFRFRQDKNILVALMNRMRFIAGDVLIKVKPMFQQESLHRCLLGVITAVESAWMEESFVGVMMPQGNPVFLWIPLLSKLPQVLFTLVL